MNQKDFLERSLDHRPWLTPVLLALLSFIFFSGVLWTPGEVLAGEDIRALFVPWLTFAVDSVKAGAFPLWNPNQFAGYPFFANIQVALFYPPTWLYLLLPIPAGLVAGLMLHVWLGGWGMARLVRRLEGSRAGALAAGVVFAFSGFMAARVEAGHVGVIATLAWTPWVLAAYWWAAERGELRRAALAGVPWALAILAGHITSMLYVGLVLLGAAVYTGVLKKRLWHAARPLLVMLAAGTALAAVQLVPTLELAGHAARLSAGYEEAARFSMPVGHLITLAVPDFFGQPTVTGYWGAGSYTEFMYYAGVLPLMLAALALHLRRRAVILFTALAAVGLMLALGEHGALYPVAYRLLPVFRLARAPARGGFLYVFGVSALAGLAVTALTDPQTRRRLTRSVTPWAAVLVSGGAALAALAAMLLFSLDLPDSEPGRLFHMGNALFGFAVWFALGSALLKWPRPTLIIGLILLDLWAFGGRLVRTGPQPPAPLWAAVQAFAAEAHHEENPFRVLPWGISIFEQNGATLTEGIESVFGYNAMGPAALDALVAPTPSPAARAYDLLNARYVVTRVPLEEPGMVHVGERDGVFVYERPHWMPRAWLAEDAEAPCAGGTGSVEIVEETANAVTLRVDAEADALLVYSGAHYPGWTAAVDGAPVEIVTAYTMLRGVCVPPGASTVTMRFWPPSLALGAAVTLGALAALAWAGRRHA